MNHLVSDLRGEYELSVGLYVDLLYQCIQEVVGTQVVGQLNELAELVVVVGHEVIGPEDDVTGSHRYAGRVAFAERHPHPVFVEVVVLPVLRDDAEQRYTLGHRDVEL